MNGSEHLLESAHDRAAVLRDCSQGQDVHRRHDHLVRGRGQKRHGEELIVQKGLQGLQLVGQPAEGGLLLLRRGVAERDQLNAVRRRVDIEREDELQREVFDSIGVLLVGNRTNLQGRERDRVRGGDERVGGALTVALFGSNASVTARAKCRMRTDDARNDSSLDHWCPSEVKIMRKNVC